MNRFALPGSQPPMIWQIGREGPRPNKPVCTNDAAVAKFFYGPPETGVEDALDKKLEGTIAPVLRAIDNGDTPPGGKADLLSPFLYFLAVRTKSFRRISAETGASLWESISGSLGSDSAKNALLREGQANFE
ncbi:MAG: DUF4238 domain-containing protein, partial [Planctomycetia bacterium]|nr:DUF4238 domain-containing protein [Planctomycetia bacterium]